MTTDLVSRFMLPILALVLCFIFSFSSAESSFSSLCKRSYSCSSGSNVTLKYPFWIANPVEPYSCGVENFQVTCDAENRPVIPLLGDYFYLKNMSASNHTITVVDTDVDKHCPRLNQSYDFTNSLFRAGHDLGDVYFSFFFNCSNGAFLGSLADSSKIECMDTTSFVIENPSLTAVDSYLWHGVCQEKVVVVGMSSIGDDPTTTLGSKYSRALGSGFVLEWSLPGACQSCEDSGGQCGVETSTKHAMCLCKNKAFPINQPCPGSSRRRRVIAGVSVAVGICLLALLSTCLCIRHRRNKYQLAPLVSRNIATDPSWKSNTERASEYFGVHLFSFCELEKATDHFDEKREVGDGGFGTVYYGKLRDGRAVAVKRLYESNYKRNEQFMNEVGILAKLNHRHLVTLYGCTSRHSRELLLVYEFIENGTVADHLHGNKAKPGSLPWGVRLSIAVETASALAYLHASDIIHRDVKTSNILLDENFRVKVGDFGLSRFFPLDATHVSTAPQGTPGYVDPEYHQCYQLTEKSDVYSFGVVLVELVSSLPAVDITRHRQEINLSNMAINRIGSNSLSELVDSTLGFESDSIIRDKISAVAELAIHCLHSNKDMRPTMHEVLETLLGIQRMEETMKQTKPDNVLSNEYGVPKLGQMPSSPNSVFAKWSSTTTTPNPSA